MSISKLILLLSAGPKDFVSHVVEYDWGVNSFLMHKDGHSMVKIYWLKEEPDRLFFSDLSVYESHRKKGFGKLLLKYHLRVAEDMNLDSFLWVDKDSWVRKWYERCDYTYFKDMPEENSVWLHRPHSRL